MPKIERRRATVRLYHGHYQQALADLVDRAAEALRKEEVQGRRFGQKSEAADLAAEYDRVAAEAQATSTLVTLYALRYDESDALLLEHPPREGEPRDKLQGVNMATYPKALVAAALVTPGESKDFDDLKAKGVVALDAMDLSRVNYKKLETAAWNVNVGDDSIPKESLASLIKQAREPDSKPQPDSE